MSYTSIYNDLFLSIRVSVHVLIISIYVLIASVYVKASLLKHVYVKATLCHGICVYGICLSITVFICLNASIYLCLVILFICNIAHYNVLA